MLQQTLQLLALATLSLAGCVRQAQGTCSFNINALQPVLADIEYDCIIYDHNCNAISNTYRDCQGGTAMYSQLAYTLDITARGGDGGSLYANFNYAAGAYSKNSPHQVQDCSSGLSGCTNLYIQFPCPAH
jgi:hypothetical protein